MSSPQKGSVSAVYEEHAERLEHLALQLGSERAAVRLAVPGAGGRLMPGGMPPPDYLVKRFRPMPGETHLVG